MEALPVLLDRYASPEEVEEVAAVFERAGTRAMVKPVWEKPPGVGNGAFWMVLVLLGVSFKSFADGFFGKLGEDAAVGFRDLVEQLRQARRESRHADDGWVEFDDPDDTSVMFGSGLPDDAYQALLELDWAENRGATLMWDEQSSEWFDPNRRYGGA